MLLQQSEAITTAEVSRALEAVLARPEYAPPQPSLLQRWVGALVHWLAEDVWPAIVRLLPLPDASAPGWKVLGSIILLIGGLVGLAFLGYWVVRGVLWWRSREQRRGEAVDTAATRPWSAAEWEARARDAAGRGEWRAAAHALYHGTLLRLGEVGVIRVDPSKTPGDYRREARRGAGVVPDLDPFLRWFERIAYGKEAPGPQHYSRFADAANAVVPRG